MEKITQIINKVRQIFKYDTLLKDIVQCPASIRIEEKIQGLKIESIIFNYFGQGANIVVLPSEIKYHDNDTNSWKTVITYKDFDELIEM